MRLGMISRVIAKLGLSYLPQSSALADDKDMGFDHSNYLEETK